MAHALLKRFAPMQSRDSFDPIAPRRSLLPFLTVPLDADAATLRRELETLHRSAREAWRLRRELAAFFLVTVALFGVSQVVREVIHPGLPPLSQMGRSWAFLLLLLVPIGWFVRRQPLPLRDLGLTTRGARESLREAALVAVGIALAGVALRLGPALRGEPWLLWGSVATYSRGEFALFLLAYGPHCLLQEFIARGVIQTSLERLLPPDAGPLAPVLVTSVLFGVFHLYVSPGFALTTFVVSALLGAFYARRRTLAGVTAVHAALGLASVAVGLN
ncbi:MAG: type II CAAX endopeptidase family protein [Deltaproteobacteria bacterium]|nr:type II CAAX endopeptidase family protein [Myxococcales bacterium]MDP3218433.1 type II CAAX endopeptidase family protein [Deltaproteobacteria bacterium]